MGFSAARMVALRRSLDLPPCGPEHRDVIRVQQASISKYEHFYPLHTWASGQYFHVRSYPARF